MAKKAAGDKKNAAEKKGGKDKQKKQDGAADSGEKEKVNMLCLLFY